jgi:imidazoleglycerol-phosphate dehydratase
MLHLMAVHGFLGLKVEAEGDLDVDFHHTVEDVGITVGQLFKKALGDRKGIRRFGTATTPMDDALATAVVDLSNRPYLVFLTTGCVFTAGGFDFSLAKEFFRAFATHGGMNLHIQVHYGENLHHMLEAIFKSVGRALAQAVSIDERIDGVRSTKGSL